MQRIVRLLVTVVVLGAAALTATAEGTERTPRHRQVFARTPSPRRWDLMSVSSPRACRRPTSRPRSTPSTPSRSTTRWAPRDMRCFSSQVPMGPRTTRWTSRSATTPRSTAWARTPSAVVINGGVTAIGKNGGGALDIFWRSVSNLTIHVVATADGCHTGNEMWAVSQAAPMRRVDVKDFTTFMPYCGNPNYASGGFVADSRLEGGALNGSQQQFYVRNVTWVPAGPTTSGTRSSLATSPRPRRTSATATPTRRSRRRR